MNLKIIRGILLAVFVVVVVLNQNVWGQNALQNAITQAGLNMEDVRSVTTFYYQNPQPDKMVSVLKVLLTVKELTSDQKHFPSIKHLFAAAAANDKDLLGKMKSAQSSLSGEPQTVFAEIIKEAENFHSPEPDSPEHLDFLWSEFFATGDAKPVKKIIGLLDSSHTSPMLEPVAQWALTSNVQQHKKVYEIVQNESSQAKGALKDILDQMLKNAGKEQ